MSNQGRALISALNRGDFQAIDQYSSLSDQDIKIVNHHVHELFERAIRTENFKLFLALIKIPRVRVSGPDYCALRHAVRQGLVEFVSEIVRVPSVNPNLRDKEGNTAISYAIRGRWTEKKALELIRAILLTGQVKLNLKGSDHKSALHLAMEKEWYELANALMDAGAHPKIEDADGVTPLSLAMKASDLDLFSKMLAFEGDAPEEEADDPADLARQDDDDDDPLSTPQDDPPLPPGNSHKGTPGVTGQSNLNSPVNPQVRQVDTTVGPKDKKDDPVPVIHRQPPPINTAPPPIRVQPAQPQADTASFSDVMEEQELDETLTKHFFFTPAADDNRIRLHRRAVLEKLAAVQKALLANNNALNPADFAKKDPETGLNLWQVTALEGHFEVALRLLTESGGFPSPEDLAAVDPEGKGVAAILDENSALQGVLNSDVWDGRSRHLAAFLSGLGPNRRAAFGTLIARTNLLLLHGG